MLAAGESPEGGRRAVGGAGWCHWREAPRRGGAGARFPAVPGARQHVGEGRGRTEPPGPGPVPRAPSPVCCGSCLWDRTPARGVPGVPPAGTSFPHWPSAGALCKASVLQGKAGRQRGRQAACWGLVAQPAEGSTPRDAQRKLGEEECQPQSHPNRSRWAGGWPPHRERGPGAAPSWHLPSCSAPIAARDDPDGAVHGVTWALTGFSLLSPQRAV